MTTRYYHKNCPLCGLEGELLISRNVATGELCFQCAECFWACDDPEGLDDYSKGYEGADLVFEAPTRKEIEQAGWGQYCVEEEEFEQDEDEP